MEEKFRTRLNVPQTLGALRGSISKKLRTDYYNYKGFFSLVLLALVGAEYRLLWIHCGSSGSSSDAQIFNRGNLREKIEDGTLGLPAPEPLGEGGPDLHCFFLGDDTFALMPWVVKPYSRRQPTREEIIANCGISKGRRVVANAFGILVSRFRVLLGTMEQRPTVVKDIVFTCVVLHNMLRKNQGGADRAPTPANDVAALQNEHVVYAPNENYRNPSREDKHLLELLKDYCNHVGALHGQKDRI